MNTECALIIELKPDAQKLAPVESANFNFEQPDVKK